MLPRRIPHLCLRLPFPSPIRQPLLCFLPSGITPLPIRRSSLVLVASRRRLSSDRSGAPFQKHHPFPFPVSPILFFSLRFHLGRDPGFSQRGFVSGLIGCRFVRPRRGFLFSQRSRSGRVRLAALPSAQTSRWSRRLNLQSRIDLSIRSSLPHVVVLHGIQGRRRMTRHLFVMRKAIWWSAERRRWILTVC